jgi:hypothetical protein
MAAQRLKVARVALLCALRTQVAVSIPFGIENATSNNCATADDAPARAHRNSATRHAVTALPIGTRP